MGDQPIMMGPGFFPFKQNATGWFFTLGKDLKQDGYGILGPMFGCVTLCMALAFTWKKKYVRANEEIWEIQIIHQVKI
jgi:hypothetical protein